MSNIQPSMFDPFSIFKYHRSFWKEDNPMGKKLLAGCLLATAVFLKVSRHFLDVKTNLIFPCRFSANKDNMAIVAIIYVIFTAISGFIAHSLRKIERREHIVQLELMKLELKKRSGHFDEN